MLHVSLKPFQLEDDLPLVTQWLQRPHVQRWWGEPEQNLDDIHLHTPESAALIVVDEKAVGFVCHQHLSREELQAAGLEDLPDHLVDIDIMLGEPDFMGRGIGPEALRLLCVQLTERGVTLVGVAAATANRRALSAFHKAGFEPYRDFVENDAFYRYFTRTL